MIIAIDGPAGSGKSTVAKKVAQMLGFHYLDTGAMYRCVAWLALEQGADLSDAEALAQIARDNEISFAHEGANPLPSKVFAAGHDVTLEIRTPRIDKCASTVSAVSGVRDALTQQQRAIAATDDIVMEGRDIGTVVFPNADVKVFLTASPEERAHRRALQNAARGFGQTDEAAILADIVARDKADSTRDVAPLVAAPDAVTLDTTGMDIDEVCERIAQLAKAAR